VLLPVLDIEGDVHRVDQKHGRTADTDHPLEQVLKVIWQDRAGRTASPEDCRQVDGVDQPRIGPGLYDETLLERP
jgi:hypothetical protein